MEAIEIARKLASLGSAAEAQDAYGLVIHQSGNPAEKLEALFDKFYRLDQARSTGTGGAGLGLAIVKNIVDMHGGDITVKSDLNGTVFTVTLKVDFDIERENFGQA